MRMPTVSKAVRVDPVRDHAWKELTRSHENSAPAHLDGWARMLERVFPRLDSRYLGIQREDRLVAGLALFHARSRLAGNRLIGLPFATFADPLVQNASELQVLLDAAREEAARVGARRIQLRCTRTADFARACGMTPTRRFKVHVLHLDRDPGQLLKTFDRSCVRQQINKALKGGLELVTACREPDFAVFYHLYLLTRKRLRLPPLPPELFSGLVRELGPGGGAEVLLARRDGVTVGGLFTLRQGLRTSFEHVGVDPEFKGPSVFHFLYWNGILRALEKGCTEVDFGRTAESNTGLMRFKKRWNTEVSDLVHYEECIGVQKDGHGSESSKDTIRYQVMQKICGISSTDALIRIGRFCYRHYM